MTTTRRFALAAVLAAGLVALHVLWLVADIGGPGAARTFSVLMGIPVPLAVAGTSWAVASRSRGRTRTGWLLLGAGLASWAAGSAVQASYRLAGADAPFPSLADVGFLGLIPFTAGAMLCFPAAPRAGVGRTRALLDGLIIATSLFALGWATVLGAAYRAAGGGISAQAVSLAYPFGDVVLIGVVLFVGARAARSERVAIALIGAGLVSIALADSLFAYFTHTATYAAGDLLDVGWTAGFLLIGLGALRAALVPKERSRDHDRPSSRFAAVLPYAAVLPGVPVAALQFASRGTLDPVVFFFGISLFVVIAIRQLLIAIENARLARHLDTMVTGRTAELERALAQLEEARRLQDQFVSNATHELRTPLTVIIGALDTLSRSEDAVWQDAPMLIDMARRGAKRMNQLVDDLLLASGITDIFGSRRDPFDISEHVRYALLSFEPSDKTVETRVRPGLLAVGDPDRFQEALDHLLANADKFGPPGSTIRVEASGDGDRVEIVVGDEGPGIPRQLRQAVFERFYQADGSNTRRYGGLGLGLYLAREVVKLMGGDVSIDDTRKGCAVRISLQAARHAPASGVVDDDFQLRVRRSEDTLDRIRRIS